jgi:hypothetical protein
VTGRFGSEVRLFEARNRILLEASSMYRSAAAEGGRLNNMQKQLEVTRSLDFDELRKLADVEGPCITVSMQLQPAPNQSRMDFQRLKSAIRQAEYKLAEGWPDLPSSTARELIESLHMLEDDSDAWRGGAGSLVILRSPGVFRAFEVQHELGDMVVVGDFFHVFPMLHALQVAEQKFYVLALSKNNIRLLRCTRTDSEQVPLPQGTPVSFEEWLNTRPVRSSPDPDEPFSGGGSTAGSFTSTTDRDKKDEHIANFFHAVNKSVTEVLRGETSPLVLCGVENERRIYAALNSYPRLNEDGVQGSPDSLKGGEMHARALEAVQDFFSQPARKALESWERLGADRALTSFPDIVKAAFETRVAHLFARDDAQALGSFDRSTMQMQVQGRQVDLVNAAALQTLAYGGDVFILSAGQVPGNAQMAAILRY